MMERTMATAFDRDAEMSPTVAATNGLTKGSLATLPRQTSATEMSSRDDCEITKKTEMAARLPPLDLRGLERKDSSSTSSSTSVPVEDSDVSSSDMDDDDVATYEDDGSLSPADFLVKPMSMLPVCPFDDLAVEDEKRRRRNVRLIKKDKNNRTHCPDAESLPSPTSQRSPAPRRFTTTQVAGGTDVARPPLSAPLLRRDSMAIRQQYWKQLGLSMSRRDLERNAAPRRERHVGLKVSLNDARSKKGESRSIFQIIAGWYAPNDAAAEEPASPHTGVTSGEESSDAPSPRRKSLRFSEEAELFYIPLHKDYTKRQRDCMWHTRHEFVSMVERNLEQVYDEMEREYEEQLQAEAAENEAMAREEARQRACEAQLRAQEEKAKAKAAAAAASAAAALALSPSPQRRTPTGSPISSPPMLALCPIATQIKVAPRARSTHDIRFKYLKHLGINN